MAQEADTAPAEGDKPAEEKVDVEVKPQDGKTFDESYVKQLRSEAAKYRTEAQEAKARAQEYEDRDKSELEKLTGKLSKAEQAKADAEARLLRFEIAAEKQIPADALDLLTGTTREELEAKAEKLLELVKSRNESEKTPDFDGGPRDPAPNKKTPEEQVNDLAIGLLTGNVNNQ